MSIWTSIEIEDPSATGPPWRLTLDARRLREHPFPVVTDGDES